jgi:hypothetical protein
LDIFFNADLVGVRDNEACATSSPLAATNPLSLTGSDFGELAFFFHGKRPLIPDGELDIEALPFAAREGVGASTNLM